MATLAAFVSGVNLDGTTQPNQAGPAIDPNELEPWEEELLRAL